MVRFTLTDCDKSQNDSEHGRAIFACWRNQAVIVKKSTSGSSCNMGGSFTLWMRLTLRRSKAGLWIINAQGRTIVVKLMISMKKKHWRTSLLNYENENSLMVKFSILFKLAFRGVAWSGRRRRWCRANFPTEQGEGMKNLKLWNFCNKITKLMMISKHLKPSKAK